MDTPDALELQVHRIHELLVRSRADVTWNDHIPDPDNPKQLRQIDITIRRDGKLALIECRLSRRRQDVKWVEELIGRRQSLGADEVTGVASAGFTAGAKKKAARFGVHLRDFQQLSDDEMTNWGRQVALRLYYYQYSEAVVSLGFAEHSVANIDPESLGQEFRSHPVLQSVFNAAASQLDTLTLLARNDTRTVGVGVAIRPDGVVLSGEPLLERRLKCKAHLVAQDIDPSGVYGYGDPMKPGLGEKPRSSDLHAERPASSTMQTASRSKLTCRASCFPRSHRFGISPRLRRANSITKALPSPIHRISTSPRDPFRLKSTDWFPDECLQIFIGSFVNER